MADKTWYTGLGDTSLDKDAMIKKPDIFISEYLFEGSGVYDSTLEKFVVSGATFDVAAFNSLGLKNLQVLDDNGKASSVLVDSNTATDILITEANLYIDEDGTTLATLTDTATYSIRVLSPSGATEPEGKFFGYTESLELNINDEFAKFKYSTPRSLKFQDLLEREVTIVGGNVEISGEDVLGTIFGTEAYGDQTGQYSLGMGSNPDISKSYRIVLVGQDRNGRAMKWVVRKTQPESSGNVLGTSESGHFLISFNFSVIADGFYPTTSDLLQIIRAD